MYNDYKLASEKESLQIRENFRSVSKPELDDLTEI